MKQLKKIFMICFIALPTSMQILSIDLQESMFNGEFYSFNRNINMMKSRSVPEIEDPKLNRELINKFREITKTLTGTPYFPSSMSHPLNDGNDLFTFFYQTNSYEELTKKEEKFKATLELLTDAWRELNRFYGNKTNANGASEVFRIWREIWWYDAIRGVSAARGKLLDRYMEASQKAIPSSAPYDDGPQT